MKTYHCIDMIRGQKTYCMHDGTYSPRIEDARIYSESDRRRLKRNYGDEYKFKQIALQGA